MGVQTSPESSAWCELTERCVYSSKNVTDKEYLATSCPSPALGLFNHFSLGGTPGGTSTHAVSHEVILQSSSSDFLHFTWLESHHRQYTCGGACSGILPFSNAPACHAAASSGSILDSAPSPIPPAAGACCPRKACCGCG